MQVKTPDIGVDKALVSELLIKVGDRIAENDSILVLESDKASVEVPSPAAGVVTAILVKLGDEVTEGHALIEIDSQAMASQGESSGVAENEQPVPEASPVTPAPASTEKASVISIASDVAVKVPDIGVEKALVAEILVKVGDTITVDQSVVLVESDKASVEVPSPVAGEVVSIAVKTGDTVKEGVLLLTVKAVVEASSAHATTTTKTEGSDVAVNAQKADRSESQTVQATPAPNVTPADSTDKLSAEQHAANAKVYAGPAVRQLARELGVLLAEVKASGQHGRIVKDDVFAYVKTRLSTPQSVASTTAAVTTGLPCLPDFSAFGGCEVKAMTRLQQVSVPQLSLNNFIPQVTQFDLADITSLEAWRGELKDGFKKQGISLTILAFIAKAVAHLLLDEPYFAAHLADDQKSVLLRNEIHMGIAVATADGLTVPVLRNPDKKSIKQIAQELADLSQKARDKKLSPKDLQGANFTITSLGSIGGTAFTPLVNWPQVAILGISPATTQPIWNGKEFEPRLMLPLSLSYDHRVINGADAARFTNKLTKLLKDIRSLLL